MLTRGSALKKQVFDKTSHLRFRSLHCSAANTTPSPLSRCGVQVLLLGFPQTLSSKKTKRALCGQVQNQQTVQKLHVTCWSPAGHLNMVQSPLAICSSYTKLVLPLTHYFVHSRRRYLLKPPNSGSQGLLQDAYSWTPVSYLQGARKSPERKGKQGKTPWDRCVSPDNIRVTALVLRLRLAPSTALVLHNSTTQQLRFLRYP